MYTYDGSISFFSKTTFLKEQNVKFLFLLLSCGYRSCCVVEYLFHNVGKVSIDEVYIIKGLYRVVSEDINVDTFNGQFPQM